MGEEKDPPVPKSSHLTLNVGLPAEMTSRNFLPASSNTIATTDVLFRAYDTALHAHPTTRELVPYILKGVDSDGDGIFQTDEYGRFYRENPDWLGNPCTVANGCQLTVTAFYDFNGIFFHDQRQADVFDLLFSYHLLALNPRFNFDLRPIMDIAFANTRRMNIAIQASDGSDWQSPPPPGAVPTLRASLTFTLNQAHPRFYENTLAEYVLPQDLYENTGLRGITPGIHGDFGCLIYPEGHPQQGQGIPIFAVPPPPCTQVFDSTAADAWGMTDADVIGTGPFRFDIWQPGLYARVLRYDDYFFGVNPNNPAQVFDPFLLTLMKPPDLQAINFTAFPVVDDGVQALLNGTIDFFHVNIPTASEPSLRARPEIRVEMNPLYQFFYLSYNMRRLPFGYDGFGNDGGWAFREAMSHLADKDALVDNQLQGYAIPAQEVVPPSNTFWHNGALPRPEFTPFVADAILDAAYGAWSPACGMGCSEANLTLNPQACRSLTTQGTVRIEILTPNYTYDLVRAAAGDMIASRMREVGINAVATPLPFSDIVTNLSARTFDMYILGWLFAPGSPDYIDNFFHSSYSPSGQNFPGFNDSAFDATIERTRADMNRTSRRADFLLAQDILADARPYEPLYIRHRIEAYRQSRFVNWTAVEGTIWNYWSLSGIRPTAAPVANAGRDQRGFRNTVVSLNGSGSVDPGGGALTYTWTQLSGPSAALIGPNTATPTFTPSQLGTYAFRLQVQNVFAATGTDTVSVTVVNRLPLTDAGPDQVVANNTLVTLDGTGSSDPDLDTLAYGWTQTSGPPVVLTGPNTTNPTFLLQLNGTYTFELAVQDGVGGSASDSVCVSTNNQPPTADAGPDQTVPKMALVTLDGSASTDPDLDPLTFSWTQVAGPPVTLTGANTATPTFTSTSAGVHVFALRVDDPWGLNGTDSMQVTVVNADPVAALAVSPATARVGQDVELTANGSMDPDGTVVSYAFEFGDGGSAGPQVAAWAWHMYAAVGTYEANVTATDNDGNISTASTLVTVVLNQGPVADAGPDQTVPKNTLVFLDGTASSDPDLDTLRYAWTQVLGTVVTLAGANTASPSFTPPAADTYVFELIVDDGWGGTAMDQVQVTATNAPPVADAGANQSVWKRTVVTLDGTGSYDPDGDPLTYYWEFIGGTYVAVNNATSATAWVFPLAQGTSLFRLTVDDGDDLGRSVATVSVTAWSIAPIANLTATPDSVRVGATVRFDGSGSFDPDFSSIGTYEFAFGDGNTVTGPFATQDHAYAAPGTYVAILTVTDDDGNKSTAQATVVVTANALPMAVAAVSLTEGTLATIFQFDGTNSVDPDGTIESWSWSFGDGTSATGAQVSHAYATKGALTVTLTVTDNEGGTGQASLVITVRNREPQIVSTDPEQTTNIASGTPQTFVVNATDADGDTLAYTWRVNGSPVGGNMPSYPFRTGAADTYQISVTVSDGEAQVSYEWTVIVTPGEQPSGTPWTLWAIPLVAAIVGLAAFVVLWRRRRKKEPTVVDSNVDAR